MSAVLSDTELQIIKLRLMGFTRKEIADKTHRSELTIKTHYQNIMNKLNANDELQIYIRVLEDYAGINIKKIIIGAIAVIVVIGLQFLFIDESFWQNVKAFISTYINF
ncbi:MAG: hypothetical protein CVU09_00425 [Bacteroidetes bacterium HGW-Bacteroidetes-4]|jgi:DNA-binding CsgD family transcriptional regulator|nr:MAG: hypothetical protein CVU09_00425 [Bacteroidetes bacterium HGW-Bacteroidetes-4]